MLTRRQKAHVSWVKPNKVFISIYRVLLQCIHKQNTRTHKNNRHKREQEEEEDEQERKIFYRTPTLHDIKSQTILQNQFATLFERLWNALSETQTDNKQTK